MSRGIFPDILKVGKITPIYKKDNPELLENYRPVSTIPIFGKIFEKVIYERLYSFMVSQNLMTPCQFGFRKGHSTSHALNYSINHIQEALKKKKHVMGIFIDLSKAFDTIDHKTLLHKLNHYGAVYKGRPPKSRIFKPPPLPLSGCVRISKTTPPPPPPRTSGFFNFYTFLFLLIKTKFIAQFLFL